jgi:hypothetical protein
MSRRSPSHAPRALQTIDPRVLTAVVGGRFSPRTTLDPVLLQGMQELSKAIASVGQNLASAKQSGTSQMMQMMQQMMESKRGR